MIKIKFLRDLPTGLEGYLLDLDAKIEVDKKAAIPVYYRENNDDVWFISDYVLRDNKAFEKTALAGLYRGGALLQVLTKEGQVTIYDERSQWLRLVGGIARYSEGADLTMTAAREGVLEELSVLTNDEKTRLVPIGMSQMVGLSIEGWGITAKNIEETGSLSTVEYFFNEVNHAFEVVVKWDISDKDGLVILHSEDWFRGGRSDFVPFVIDDKGNIVGLYDGRHGFVSMPVKKLHSTLKAILPF